MQRALWYHQQRLPGTIRTYTPSTRQSNSRDFFLKWNQISWKTLQTQEGIIQGCPLSPIFGTLVLHPILKSLEEKLQQQAAAGLANNIPGNDGFGSHAHLFAYMDDISLTVALEDVQFSCKEMDKLGTPCGCFINTLKTRILTSCNGHSILPQLHKDNLGLASEIKKTISTYPITYDKITNKTAPVKLVDSLGLSICHHFDFNYILNLYVLSMCFMRYHSWIVCTVYNAVPMLIFRLRKFLMRILAFPLRPRYIRCSTTCLLPSLSKKLLDHFGVIINSPFVTPAVIFFINNWNFHSNVCNGSCLFLHTPHPAGVDVFEQQAPNDHSVHVHVSTPCINLSFVCIIHPLVLNRYCGIAREFLCLKQANYCLLLTPQ